MAINSIAARRAQKAAESAAREASYERAAAARRQQRAVDNARYQQQLQAYILQYNYNQAYRQARTANETRYQEMLGIVNSMGGQESADINRQYSNLASAGQQDLVSRGLAGTTVMPTMRATYARGRTEAQGRLQDRLRGQRVGIMERRTDSYPDQGAYLQLMQGLGRY